MVRFLIRALGLLVLAAAVVSAGYDGFKSYGEGTILITKVGDAWSSIDRDSLLLLQPAIERHIEPYIGAWLWDPVILTVLTSPLWLVLGVIGVVLLLLGREPPPPEDDLDW